jgi:neurotransmitter:Na+ symporter, NSS family
MERAHWGSRLGFVLAASGSAVGLGNLWKFPYIAGANGGGAFVLLYLVFILLVGLPVMIAEIMIGRASQRSPVGAFRALAQPRTRWGGFGFMGVIAAFLALSYYATVAGWAMHYSQLALRGEIAGADPEAARSLFGRTAGSTSISCIGHFAFISITVAVVLGGVRRGLERASRVLMPLLLLMMIALLVKALGSSGFDRAADFVFGFHAEDLSAAGLLEALGHAFFTLSLGVGGMITYGSYLDRRADLLAGAVATTALDTAVALLACLILFPITFSFGMSPAAGPGLVFVNMPVALAQMPGATIWASLFFLLLVFAALTSGIALLEVVVSYLIDEREWSRPRAVLSAGGAVALFGLPSALSSNTELFGARVAAWAQPVFGASVGSWFDLVDHLVTNWMLPLGGMGIAVFCAWRLPESQRFEEFTRRRKLLGAYRFWLLSLRFIVPAAIAAVFAGKLGILEVE